MNIAEIVVYALMALAAALMVWAMITAWLEHPDPLNAWAKRHGNLLTDKLTVPEPRGGRGGATPFPHRLCATRTSLAKPSMADEAQGFIIINYVADPDPYRWHSTSDIVGR